MTLCEALAELEQVAHALGDDAPVESDLLDLATLALALRCPALWKESDPVMTHFDSPVLYVPGELLFRCGALWQVIGWKRRGKSYRVTVERS